MTANYSAIDVESQFANGFDGFVYHGGHDSGGFLAAFVLEYSVQGKKSHAPIRSAIRRVGTMVLGEDDVIKGSLCAYEELKLRKKGLETAGVTGLGLIAVRNTDMLAIVCGGLLDSIQHSFMPEGTDRWASMQLEDIPSEEGKSGIHTWQLLPGHHISVSFRPHIAYDAHYAPCQGPGMSVTVVMPHIKNMV